MLRKPVGTDLGLLGREALAVEIFSTAHDPAKSKRKAWRQDHYQSCRTLIKGNATMLRQQIRSSCAYAVFEIVC